MRPIRLQMLGFGTFRDETEVDFTDLELVALVGGTGSGKSTIIDAITFALFGRISRIVDGRKVAHVVNAMSAEARVVFTFEVAGATYTAIRVVRRTRTGATTKEARLESGDRILADSADDISAEIEKLTGLDFDRFTRVVVLPQGKFAAFLHDGKTARRALLRSVLGLEIYERLGQRARSISKEAATQLEVLRPKLEAGGISDEALAELEQTRDSVSATKLALDDALAVRQSSSAARDTALKLAEDFGVLVLAVANVQVPAAVIALGDKITEAETASAAAVEDLARAQAVVEASDQACSDGPDLADCRRLIAVHVELADEVATRDDLAAALAAAQRTRNETTARVIELDDAITEAEKALVEAEVAEQVALAALSDGPSQADLDRDRTLLQAVASLEAEVKPAQAEIADAVERCGRAASALEEAVEQLDDTAANVRRIENENHAHVLVGSLVQGDACPVCQQTVKEVPELSISGELATAASARAEAEQALAKARETSTEAEMQQAAAESQLAGATKRLEAARTAASNAPSIAILNEQQVEIERLRTVAATAKDVREKASTAARQLRESDDARSARTDATEAASTHTRIEASLAATEQNTVKLQQQLDGKASQADLTIMAEQAEKLVAQHAEAVDAKKLVDQAVKSASVALDQLKDSERTLRQEFTSTWAGFKAIDAPTPQGASLLEDWQTFANWSTTQQEPLEKQYAKASKVADAAVAKVTEDERAIRMLTSELAGIGDSHEIDELSPVVVKLLAQAESAVNAAHARRKELEDDEAQVAQLEESQQVHDMLGNRLLKSSGFEQWMMEEVVHALVERASERLFELSGGQYSIESDDMEFEVRDHRNGDELRNARTLSGGETFLASLALALALADSLHAMAPEGTAPLESLFLDEGFGTLDPDTLDVVAGAIEELGASGRMVGIITHIRELAERMPVRFEVAKEATSSVVVRVEA